MKILVTGGAGYIGSHTTLELLNNGYDVVVVDNLSNSSVEAIQRVQKITKKQILFYEFDIRDDKKLNALFQEHIFDAVIHFAGFKAVGESVTDPLRYYTNNIHSTLILLDTMKRYGVKKLIFSSSAAVYGTPETLPLTETSRTGVGITNPYGQTKHMVEQMIRDASLADEVFEGTILRYFNPIGAHESGLIGEDPSGIPNNVMPYISQVAVGKHKVVNVYGGDYDTPDGTGVRDYIHVVDLARGHLAALSHSKKGAHTYNLSSGKGTSVLELIAALGKAAKKKIPYQILGRRAGDIAACYANPTKAKRDLEWVAEKTLEEACADSWRWQSTNPNGYAA